MPLEIVRNDITKMKVDAIVNPTDRAFSGAGGLDATIHRAAGPGLLKACRALGGCDVGGARITRGYLLPAKYVIHTVGPVWRGGANGERELLTSCYQNALDLARERECESIAFPLISAGTFGYPKDEALAVALDVIGRFLLAHDMMVYLVMFGRTEYLASKKLFRDVQEYIDDVYVSTHYTNRQELAGRERWYEDAASAPMMGNAPEDFSDRCMCGSEPALPQAFDWDEVLKQTDEGFSDALLRLIDEKGLTDAQCYKRANIDKRLFSKIRSNPDYKPSKPTVFAFAVALKLSLTETADLLRKAGFAISHSSKFDIIMEYFIKKRFYNIYEINEVLFDYDMPLLGTSTK